MTEVDLGDLFPYTFSKNKLMALNVVFILYNKPEFLFELFMQFCHIYGHILSIVCALFSKPFFLFDITYNLVNLKFNPTKKDAFVEKKMIIKVHHRAPF